MCSAEKMINKEKLIHFHCHHLTVGMTITKINHFKKRVLKKYPNCHCPKSVNKCYHLINQGQSVI